MSRLRGFVISGILGGLAALVAGFIISDSKTSSTLYCVTNPSSHITTLSASIPQAKCFRVQNGVFTDVFEDVPKTNGEDVKSLDGYVLPGLIDSHGHILQYGEMLESVSLYGAESVSEVRARVKEFLENIHSP